MKPHLLRPFLPVPALGLLGWLLACGTGGLPHTNQVSVTVTPSTANLAPGASVTLTGSGTGFTATPVMQWYVQDSKDIDFINDCGFLTNPNPPSSGCPYGYVMYSGVSQFPSSATYYAPSAPGTYHVTFEATQFITFDHVGKAAQATMTVQ